MKILILAALVLLGCTIRVIQPARTTAEVDSVFVRQAVIIGTKSDSVIEWEEWVVAIKDTLWVDACRQILMSITSGRVFEQVKWSGDFKSYVGLEALSYRQHLLPPRFVTGEEVDYGEETHFFMWRRDPVNGLWKRKYK